MNDKQLECLLLNVRCLSRLQMWHRYRLHALPSLARCCIFAIKNGLDSIRRSKKNGIFAYHEQNYSHARGIGHVGLVHFERRAKDACEVAHDRLIAENHACKRSGQKLPLLGVCHASHHRNRTPDAWRLGKSLYGIRVAHGPTPAYAGHLS